MTVTRTAPAALIKPECSCYARGRRWSQAAGAALPGAIAILLPKCPLCIAAWVAAATGLTLPTMVAGSFRPFLVIACVVLVFLLVRPALERFRLRGSPRFRASRRLNGQ